MSLDAIEQQQLRAAQRTRLEQMAHDLKFSKSAEQQHQSEQAQPQHYQQPPAQQPPHPPLAPAVAVSASQGYTQHENELSKDHNDAISSSFQRLSLAIPIDPSNYTFISMFLSRVLNLTQANEILPKDKDLQRKESPTDDEFQFNSSNVRKSTDILPNIAVPNDIWLVDNIQVKDIKIKTNILSEINNISGLSDSENITIDETTLIYYEKLLTAYKVYDVPNRQSIISSYYSNTPSTYSSHSSYIGEQSLKEEDNEDEQSTYAPSTPIDNITESDEFEDTKQIARTNSNQSSAHSQRTHGSSGHSTASNHSSNHVISGPLSSNGHNAYNNGAVLNNNNNNNNNNSNNNNGHSNYNNNHNGHTSLPALASKRISGLSQRKRFSALLGQVTHSSGTNSAHHSNISHNSGSFPEDISISTTNSSHSPAITSPTTTIGSYPNDEEHKKQQNLNNLLAKSRIYNKIKRNRESASSLSSSLSFPSSYSNRNSISTTNTTSSNSSRRRSNSSYFPGSSDNGDSKFSSVSSHTATGSAAASIITSSVIPTSYSPIPLLSISQKAENRKLKHDYYVQLAELMATTKKILDYSMTNNNGGIAASASNSKLMKFMEFIKKKILKFIIIDVFQMIVDYAQLRAFDLFNRP